MPRSKNRKKRRGRPGALTQFSTAQLAAEMNRRRSMLHVLANQLESITLEIAEIELVGIGGSATPPGPGLGRSKNTSLGRTRRGRGGNKQSLPSLLHSLLRGKTMSVPELTVAAKKAGHKSKSKNFSKVVSLALLTNRPMFKRVSRGQYTAK